MFSDETGGLGKTPKVQDYRAHLKVGVLEARGVLDKRLLSTTTELDTTIPKLAARVLSKSERIIFYYAFVCTSTFKEIRELLLKVLEKEYKLDTVETYARDAASKIIEAAQGSRELDEWQAKFSRSQKTN